MRDLPISSRPCRRAINSISNSCDTTSGYGVPPRDTGVASTCNTHRAEPTGKNHFWCHGGSTLVGTAVPNGAQCVFQRLHLLQFLAPITTLFSRWRMNCEICFKLMNVVVVSCRTANNTRLAIQGFARPCLSKVWSSRVEYLCITNANKACIARIIVFRIDSQMRYDTMR